MLDSTNDTLVLSGILAEQEASVTDRLPLGTEHSISRDGEWIAIVVIKR
jgi:ribosomal protein L11 methylase PrmA